MDFRVGGKYNRAAHGLWEEGISSITIFKATAPELRIENMFEILSTVDFDQPERNSLILIGVARSEEFGAQLAEKLLEIWVGMFGLIVNVR